MYGDVMGGTVAGAGLGSGAVNMQAIKLAGEKVAMEIGKWSYL